MEPNISEATIHRWYEGDDPRPVYVVTWWENAVWENTVEDRDPEDEDPGEIEHERRFSTLDAALKFARQILSTTGLST